jgi:microcystin-dependent protein
LAIDTILRYDKTSAYGLAFDLGDKIMSSVYIGQIIHGGWNFAPRGFAYCNGQSMAIQQNTALFSLLGTTYGGNGTTTFNLPDLRGRSAVNQGQGPGLSNLVLGQQGGTENVTLTTPNMPAHNHPSTFTSTSTLGASTTKATLQAPGAGTVLARTKDGATPGPSLPLIYLPSGTATDVNLGGLNVAGTVSNAVVGGNVPFAIRDPYLAVSIVIAVQGIFPSRN